MLRRKRFWFGIVISVGLMAFVLYQADPAKILKAIQQAQYTFLLPALALYFLGVAVRAGRWHYLLRNVKPIPTGRLFRVIVIGYMANDILPARMGEFVRAYVLGKQQGLSKTTTLVTILVERLFDALTMLTFIVMASFLLQFGDETLSFRVRSVSAIIIAAIIGLAVLAGMPQRVERVADFVIARFPSRWHARAMRLTRSFLAGLGVLRRPRDSLSVFALSMLAWLCETGMYALIARGFEIQLRFAVYLLAAAFANLVTIVPSTPGYIGVFHAPIVYTLTTFGVEFNLAASYTIVLHAALILPVTLLGFYYAARAGMSLTQMTHAESEFSPVSVADAASDQRAESTLTS